MSGLSTSRITCIVIALPAVLAAGCSSTDPFVPSEDIVIDSSAVESVADFASISYDEMMARGNVALEDLRFQAAVRYFGAALTARPSSQDAIRLLAEARMGAARFKGSGETTGFELSLPPPPPFAMSQVDELIWKLGRKRIQDDDSEIVGPTVKTPEEQDEAEGATALRGDRKPFEMIPRVPSEGRGERPSIVRPTPLTSVGVPSRLPLKPLRTGRNDLFHVLVHLPAFEGARTLPSKTWEIETGADVSWGNLNSGSYGHGLYLKWDNNRYDEGYLKIAHGLTEDIEPRIELTFGNLREGGGDVYLTDQFDAYITDYDRRTDLGNLLFGVKARLYRPVHERPESGVSGELSLKIPVARNPKNFTTSGMPDLAGWLTGSWDFASMLKWPRLVLHASIGMTLPLGDNFFEREVDLDPVALFGVGACIQLDDSLALVGQLQGNTSAFGEFAPLSTLTVSAHMGVRVLLGHFIIEGSVGNGLSGTSSTMTFALNVGLRAMGRQIGEVIAR